MVTKPEPVDAGLTIERESSVRQLAEYIARLLRTIQTSREDERAYAIFLAENVERVQSCTCNIIRSAINPSEQTRILYAANPWLHEVRDRLDSRAYSKQQPDGTTVTLTEWVFDDETLTSLTRRADRIVAEAVRITDPSLPSLVPENKSARRAWNSAKAPAVLYDDKLDDLRDRLMPERCLGPWIKFGDLRQWLDHCDRVHTTHCRLSAKSQEIFAHHPRWLVDVEQRCLVEAGPGQRYLALSYVWGTHTSFQTLTGNLDALKEAGSLLPPRPSLSYESEQESSGGGGGDDATTKKTKIAGIENIARTVSDVIEFVDRLGEQYLWVDALCIVQDDDADKQEHLSHMGSIYANAYATIVVINGPSDRGLAGIQDVTPAMSRARAGVPYTPHYVRRPENMATAVFRHAEAMQRSVWNRRAWTFQEQIFSRRLLILNDTEITWECHCNVWLEGVRATESQCARNTAVVAQGFSFHLDPRFKDYALHAQQYNRRQFSYPEDAMDAFAGILTVLRTTFSGGFICCLPVMFFDTALLWYNEGILEVRTPARRRACDGLAPTWAWAAYGGKIAFPDFSTAREGVRPLVRWKYCQGSEQVWTPVASLEKQQPEKRFPTAAELSELAAAIKLEDGGGPVAAGDPSFPVGMGSIYHHVLHARPERAFFSVLEYYGDEGVPLVGASGECVGVLTPSRKLGSHTVDAKTVISCELVAVSESFINGMETYNVLWIEKKQDVYVRKGVGRILKSDWVAQKPERIDLLLM